MAGNLVEILIVGKNLSKEAFREATADGATMGDVLKKSGMIGAEALVAVGVEAVKMASNYQLSTTRLVTSAGEQQKYLKLVQDGMLTMAGQVGISAQHLSEAMYYVEAAGYHAGAGLTVLRAAAQGAVAENADVTDVAKALTDVLKDYHLAADQAATYTSKMITAVAHGKVNLEDFSKSFASIIPAASAAGISFDDVGAALSEMTNHGFTAQRASQNLADALRHLLNPTKGMATEYQLLGGSVDELHKRVDGPNGLTEGMQYASQIAERAGKVGTPAYAAALKLLMGTASGANAALATTGENSKDTTATLQAMAGTTADASGKVAGFALVQKTFGQELRQLDAGFQSLLIRIGDKLLPVLSKFIGYVMTNGAPAVKKLADVLGQNFAPVASQVVTILHNLQPIAETVFKVFAGAGYLALVSVAKVLHDVLNPALIALTGFLKDNEVVVQGVVVGYIAYRTILTALAVTTAVVEGATKAAAAAQGIWTAATWLFRDSEIAAAAGLEISRIGAVAYAAQALLVEGATKAWTAATWLLRDSEIAMGVQMYVVEGATKAWTAAQWLLNVALDANPIGVTIGAIALLAVGFYELYNHSLLVREVVATTFSNMGAAAGLAARSVLIAFRFIQDAILNLIGFNLDMGAKLFGWIPGIGPKLKQADQAFNSFQQNTDAGFDGLIAKVDDFNNSMNTATAVKVLQMDIGAWQQNLDKAKAELASVPPSKRAAIQANIDDLTHKIQAAQNQIDHLQGKIVTITFNGVATGITPPPGYSYQSTTGYSYAAGGVVSTAAVGGARSGRVLVGEHGPELVKLPQGSSVMPAGQTRQMLADSGGGVGRIQVEWVGANAGDEFMQWLRNNIRFSFGGDVQRALGQGY